MEEQSPSTIVELKAWMKQRCFNFDSYSIGGNNIYEGYGIDWQAHRFAWYYTERGQQHPVQYFETEKEIVQYAFDKISTDKWARAHYVGITSKKVEAVELANKLTDLGIAFLQDDIPYYGPERPAFRTFVFGCDINRVLPLKAKYNKRIP